METYRFFATSFARLGVGGRTPRSPGLVTQQIVPSFTNRPERRGLKQLLAGLATSCAALVMSAPMALAAPLDPSDPGTSQCSTSGTIITCEGDLSSGIDLDARGGLYDELILDDILPNGSDPGFISPGDYHGIYVRTDGSFTIENSADDPFTIKQTSSESLKTGLYLSGTSGDGGTLSVQTHGSIETTGSSNNHGLLVFGKDHVIDVRHIGDISLLGTGTRAIAVGDIDTDESDFGRSISVYHEGAIFGSGDWNHGISVEQNAGSNVSITQRGHITFEPSGISNASYGFRLQGGASANFGDGTVDVVFVGDFRSVNDDWSLAQVANFDIGVRNSDPTTANVNFQQIGDIDIVNYHPQAAIEIRHRSGHTTVDYTGALRVHGPDSKGILVNARETGGTVEVQLGYEGIGYDNQLTSGAVIVASRSGIRSSHYGVQLISQAGASNQVGLHNDVIIGGWGEDAIDIQGGAGDDSINNYGTYSSANGIALDGGANFLNNHEGATFNSGASINLGTDEIATNTIQVFVDEDGRMIRTRQGTEAAPPGENWTIENRLGNTFYNHGIFSPRGEDYEELFLADYAETIDDESQTIIVTAGLGTTQLTGNFEQADTGFFMANINTTTGDSDKLEILGDGIAQLGGTLVVMADNELADDETRYVILTVADGSIIGEFDIPDLSSYNAEYFDDRVEVYFEGFKFTCKTGGPKNQRVVSCPGVSSLPDDHPINEALRTLFGDNKIDAAYADLSGEVHASLSGVLMESSLGRSDAVLTRLNASTHRPEGDSFALLHDTKVLSDFRSDLNWWVKGQGGMLSRDDNAEFGTAELDHEEAGLIIGTDFTNEDWTVGVTFGWSQGTTEVDDRRSEGDTQTWSMGLYGGTSINSGGVPVNFSFGAFANFHEIETDRRVAFGQLNEALNADYDASSFQAFAEVASNFDMGSSAAVFQPFINVSHVALDTDGYTESLVGGGVSQTALQVDDSSQSLSSTKLGLRASTDIPAGNERSNIRLFGELGWCFNFGDVEPETQMAFIGGDRFTITGSPVSDNAFSGQFGIAAELGQGVFLQASYRGEFSEDSEAHSINAGLIGRF